MNVEKSNNPDLSEVKDKNTDYLNIVFLSLFPIDQFKLSAFIYKFKQEFPNKVVMVIILTIFFKVVRMKETAITHGNSGQ